MATAKTSRPERGVGAAIQSLELPRSRTVKLAGHGRVHFRERANPGKPVLLLLHGMFASGTLNWFQSFDALAEHFHIIAPDMRGHGRSIRGKRFSLEHCADDIDALLTHLGHDSVIAVGYSMGGAITQRLWERHPHRLQGMVLTATGFEVDIALKRLPVARPFMGAMVAMARLIDSASKQPRAMWRKSRWPLRRLPAPLRPSAPTDRAAETALRQLRRDLSRTNLRVQLEAAQEMTFFDGSHLLEAITIPAAVVVTARDALFSAAHQSELAARIPTATRFEYDGGHVSCTHTGYAPILATACLDVSRRIAG